MNVNEARHVCQDQDQGVWWSILSVYPWGGNGENSGHYNDLRARRLVSSVVFESGNASCPEPRTLNCPNFLSFLSMV